jgi:hypothetical protein
VSRFLAKPASSQSVRGSITQLQKGPSKIFQARCARKHRKESHSPIPFIYPGITQENVRGIVILYEAGRAKRGERSEPKKNLEGISRTSRKGRQQEIPSCLPFFYKNNKLLKTAKTAKILKFIRRNKRELYN